MSISVLLFFTQSFTNLSSGETEYGSSFIIFIIFGSISLLELCDAKFLYMSSTRSFFICGLQYSLFNIDKTFEFVFCSALISFADNSGDKSLNCLKIFLFCNEFWLIYNSYNFEWYLTISGLLKISAKVFCGYLIE